MTREEIIDMAKQSGFDPHDMSSDFTCNLDNIEAFARLVAEHEREECGVIAKESFCGCGRSSCIDGDLRAHNIAASIRARGNHD